MQIMKYACKFFPQNTQDILQNVQKKNHENGFVIFQNIKNSSDGKGFCLYNLSKSRTYFKICFIFVKKLEIKLFYQQQTNSF